MKHRLIHANPRPARFPRTPSLPIGQEVGSCVKEVKCDVWGRGSSPDHAGLDRVPQICVLLLEVVSQLPPRVEVGLIRCRCPLLQGEVQRQPSGCRWPHTLLLAHYHIFSHRAGHALVRRMRIVSHLDEREGWLCSSTASSPPSARHTRARSIALWWDPISAETTSPNRNRGSRKSASMFSPSWKRESSRGAFPKDTSLRLLPEQENQKSKPPCPLPIY